MFDSFHLDDSDPFPVNVINGEIDSDFLIVCEHAGREVPKCLGNLGIDPREMDRHIAYDVGAEAVSRRLGAILMAPLYMQRYSRLVIDCNRPLEADDCIAETSDGTEIPCNFALTKEARCLRHEKIHRPFHNAVSAGLDRAQARDRKPVLLNIHSFTPVMRQTGEIRSIELGCCFNRDERLAKAMLTEVQSAYPEVIAAPNYPYSVDDIGDYTIPVHGEQRNIPHVLLEIRNDLISDEAGQALWAEIIAHAAQAAAKMMKVGV